MVKRTQRDFCQWLLWKKVWIQYWITVIKLWSKSRCHNQLKFVHNSFGNFRRFEVGDWSRYIQFYIVNVCICIYTIIIHETLLIVKWTPFGSRTIILKYVLFLPFNLINTFRYIQTHCRDSYRLGKFYSCCPSSWPSCEMFEGRPKFKSFFLSIQTD